MFTFLIGEHRAREETIQSKHITFLRETQGKGEKKGERTSGGVTESMMCNMDTTTSFYHAETN